MSIREYVWNNFIKKFSITAFRDFIQLTPNEQCEILLNLALETDENRFNQSTVVLLCGLWKNKQNFFLM